MNNEIMENGTPEFSPTKKFIAKSVGLLVSLNVLFGVLSCVFAWFFVYGFWMSHHKAIIHFYRVILPPPGFRMIALFFTITVIILAWVSFWIDKNDAAKNEEDWFSSAAMVNLPFSFFVVLYSFFSVVYSLTVPVKG